MSKKNKSAPRVAVPAPIAEGNDGRPLSSCRVCGSTNRGPMTETSRQLLDGKIHIWLRTQCVDCSQWRVDRLILEVSRPRPLTAP